MTSPRPVLKTLVTLAALVALLAPFAVALATGWIEIHITPWSEQPGPDPTPIEAWAVLALVYLVWAPLVMFGVVLAFDRLGYKYTPPEGDPRPPRKQRRRRDAGLKFLQSREAPPAGAPAARPARGARSSPAHPEPGTSEPPQAGD
jgi:hypothetical protein